MALRRLPQRQGPPIAPVVALSSARSRALSLLHAEMPIHPDIFAHYMWPESTNWSRHHQPGRAIRAKANSFLARLERDGLARRCEEPAPKSTGYVISSQGAEAVGAVYEAPAEMTPSVSDR